MATVLEDRLTADDLLTMPDGDRYELIDGELVERDMGAKAGWVAGEVFAHLRDYARRNGGRAFTEGTGYR